MPDDSPKPRATIQFILPVSEGMVTLGNGRQIPEHVLSERLATSPGVFTTKGQDGSVVVVIVGGETAWELFPDIGAH